MALTDLTADAIQGYEPQRTNNALVTFAVNGLSGYGTFSGGSGVSGSPSQSILLLSVDNFQLPQLQMSSFELAYLNETRKYLGRPSYGSMNITFKDFVDANTAQQLYLWYVASHNTNTGQTIFKSSYVCQGYAIMYGPDGSLPREFQLWNCSCQSYVGGQASMAGDGPMEISTTILIDKTYPIVYSSPGNTY
jgi:hypothetical protein